MNKNKQEKEKGEKMINIDSKTVAVESSEELKETLEGNNETEH